MPSDTEKAEDSVTAIVLDAHAGPSLTETEKPSDASNVQVSEPRASESDAAGCQKEGADQPSSEAKIEGEVDAGNDNEAEGEKEAEAEKPLSNPELERKREIVAGEAKKAGKRLFGMMLGTLKSLKDDNSKRSKTAGAQKRREIEQRSLEKVKGESARISARKNRDADLRRDRDTLRQRKSDLALLCGQFNTRQSARKHLKSFLCTPLDAKNTSITGTKSSAIVNTLPHVMHQPKAVQIYYLPRKCTPEQEEQLARQKLQAHRLEVEEKEAFEAKKQQLSTDISRLQDAIAQSIKSNKAEDSGQLLPQEASESSTDHVADVPMTEAPTSLQIKGSAEAVDQAADPKSPQASVSDDAKFLASADVIMA